jgi:glycosyltransferase involved in cell wall biosynthesis
MTLPLSVVVFAYNEETNVPLVLPAIHAWLRGRGAPYELIFVDDGSTDATAERARQVLAGDAACCVVSHPRNGGIGAALKTGYRHATLPWFSFLPCDGQIPCTELDALCRAAESACVPVVFSVYRNRDDGLMRKVLSQGVRALIYAVHGVVMRSDGPYLVARELFHPELLQSDTFFLNFEFPIRMLREQKPYRVVTIECQQRLSGRSKSTGWKRIAGVARDLVHLKLRLAREASGSGTCARAR